MERVSLFVDGANMFYLQRKLGFHIDYKKLLDYFAEGRELYNAFYYTGLNAPSEVKDRKFLEAMTYIGYTVRTKHIKEIVDSESGETIQKANLDIEIVIDMFNTVNQYDVAVLLSGDGDFERAVELIRSKGKRIIAASTKGMASYELVNAVDKYVDLAFIRDRIEKIRPQPSVTASLSQSGVAVTSPMPAAASAPQPTPVAASAPQPAPAAASVPQPSSPQGSPTPQAGRP
ncbi:MAG: NYN domain-containing protein [Chloroflexota bacterium]